MQRRAVLGPHLDFYQRIQEEAAGPVLAPAQLRRDATLQHGRGIGWLYSDTSSVRVRRVNFLRATATSLSVRSGGCWTDTLHFEGGVLRMISDETVFFSAGEYSVNLPHRRGDAVSESGPSPSPGLAADSLSSSSCWVRASSEFERGLFLEPGPPCCSWWISLFFATMSCTSRRRRFCI